VDYFLPGGICRSVSLAALPQVFISDVHAKPVNVLQPGRTVDVTVTLNAAASLRTPCKIKVELTDAGSPVAAAEQSVSIAEEGGKAVSLTLSNLGDIKLWDTDSPHLYQVTTTLMLNGQPAHVHRTRIGFREARFTVDGFFLNGKRKQLFGLDRHELYPYVGNAMPPRVMRRDAAILRHDFNCNIVRCSHYPQTEAFLDACDELGLMVWQEPPGWGYLGDEAWKNLVVRDVTEMILRDRNHAAIVIWGVRVNESRNDPPLYRRTTEVAQLLDGTRPTSGSMTSGSRGNWREGWHEDVFAFDDYHSDPDGSVGIDKPTPGVPYMLAETVGQFSYGAKGFNNKYRRAGDLNIQVDQAVFHAQAHEKAARNRNNCGVIAWCAFDYGSPLSSYSGVKCPGVSDVFRIPKLGAAFYLAQTDPKTRPLILPAFYWDFGPKTPRGPGKHAPIFSNCERLEIFVAGQRVAAVQPDRENYSHLQYPPFFCDLDLDGSARPELRIDGYIGSTLSLSKIFSSDPAKDQFLFAADDTELIGDGADATRLAFKVADQYGTERAFGGGEVKFELTGPGILVGDNPFSLPDSGGVGAVWIKSAPKGEGDVAVTATHSVLGQKMVVIKVKAASDAFSS
jgi:beta-galactosidase